MIKDRNSSQNHQYGSKLEHFWPDGRAGNLRPVEQKLLDQVAFGEIWCDWPGRQPQAHLKMKSRFWRRIILGPLIDYGYRPGKAGLHLITAGLGDFEFVPWQIGTTM